MLPNVSTFNSTDHAGCATRATMRLAAAQFAALLMLIVPGCVGMAGNGMSHVPNGKAKSTGWP